MTIKNISREYSRTVFIDRQGSVTAKAGIEASVVENENIDAAYMALHILIEREVEKTLKAKLGELVNL